MFSPLAFTLGYALLGSLILSVTYVPAMIKVLLTRNIRERENWISKVFQNNLYKLFQWSHRWKKTTIFGFISLLTACAVGFMLDRKSTRLNSSHVAISYAVFCLKK